MSSLRVVVVGGGIGGICTAIALRRRGHEVTVLEAQDGPREVGAGLSLWLNARRALKSLGVGDFVDALSVPSASGGVFDHHGRSLSTLSMSALEDRFGGSTVIVHRPDFLKGLWDRCDADLRGSSQVDRVHSSSNGASVVLNGGDEIEADLVIGADGIGSRVRESIGITEPRRYSGVTAYRGVMQLEDAGLRFDDEFWGVYLARGIHAGVAPMAGNRVYWFVAANGPEGGRQGPGGHHDDVAKLVECWPETVSRIVEATPDQQILRNDLYDLPPLDRWSDGDVVLLGDAAHATTPNLGQGACMAIEDAVVLGKMLDQHGGDIAAAIAAYEQARMDRCNRVTATSRTMGRVLQLENPLLSWMRNRVLAATSESSQLKRLAWLLEYEA